MCMVSLYLLAILCCHTIDWDIFLRYWCLSQIYYYYYYYYPCVKMDTRAQSDKYERAYVSGFLRGGGGGGLYYSIILTKAMYHT